MIKKMSLRKITITTLALLITGLFYFFPINNNELKINETINYYDEEDYKSMYLMDKHNYVSKLKLPIEETKEESIIKERLNYLIINSTKKNNIPNGFRPIIPNNTKIISIKIEEDLAIINFSKELLEVNISDEEQMIEAIIFSVTESNSIDKVKILVEGEKLTKLPHSEKTLPNILDRNYGINKIYEFDKLSGITKTIIYYVNEINDEIYYTPVTKVSNDSRDKVTIIIEELKSSIIYQSNLSSYLNSAVELNEYQINDDSIILFFNENIFDSNSKSILEEVEYTISMSLMDNLEISEVIYNVNGKEIIKTLE